MRKCEYIAEQWELPLEVNGVDLRLSAVVGNIVGGLCRAAVGFHRVEAGRRAECLKLAVEFALEHEAVVALEAEHERAWAKVKAPKGPSRKVVAAAEAAAIAAKLARQKAAMLAEYQPLMAAKGGAL